MSANKWVKGDHTSIKQKKGGAIQLHSADIVDHVCLLNETIPIRICSRFLLSTVH